MLRDLPLRCRCGHVRGVATELSPSAGFRLVCYCKDCQAFAHFLQRTDVLDEAGGTDIFQMPPARVTFTAGVDVLRCLRLSEKGVFRWYAECCRTPIANAVSPRVPVIGVFPCFMTEDFMDDAAGSRSQDEALGPPLFRINEGSAIGPLPPMAPPPASFGVLAYCATKAVRWRLRGLGRPSPFFVDRTNAPRSVPRVLTQSERAAL